MAVSILLYRDFNSDVTCVGFSNLRLNSRYPIGVVVISSNYSNDVGPEYVVLFPPPGPLLPLTPPPP